MLAHQVFCQWTFPHTVSWRIGSTVNTNTSDSSRWYTVDHALKSAAWHGVPHCFYQACNHPYRDKAGMRYCSNSLHYLPMCHTFSCPWSPSAWSWNLPLARWETFQPKSSQGQDKRYEDCHYRPPVCWSLGHSCPYSLVEAVWNTMSTCQLQRSWSSLNDVQNMGMVIKFVWNHVLVFLW